jgi:type IV secretory pathway VirB2 component (pilin)
MKRQNKASLLPRAGLAGLLLALPVAAEATTAGGGGMPWSTGLGTFTTSLTGEIAFFIVVCAVLGGGAYFVMSNEFGVLAQRIGAILITMGLVGGIVQLAGMMGMTGAIV